LPIGEPLTRSGSGADRDRLARANRTPVAWFAAESSAAKTAHGTPVAESSSVARSSQQGVTAFRTHSIARQIDDAPERTDMMNLIARMRAFAVNDEGQDLLEYALLVALIALVASAAIGLAGTNVNVIFGRIATQLGTTS